MSGQNDRWKWLFVGLLIAVTLIGASLWVNWRFTEMQMNFNKRVAANAANTNAQITSLVDENAGLQEQILQLEQAILDLDNWITEDQSRQNQQINNQQSDIQRLNSRIDSNANSISRLWSEIYDLQDRVKILECEVFHDSNCTAPECPTCGMGTCPECGSPGYTCDYCGSSWCNRYDCGYCPTCGP